MVKLGVTGIMCLILLFAATPPAMAQFCPEPGSGADVVEVFKDACDECERGPVTTCREDFAITLTDINRNVTSGKITFIYKVHNTPDTSVDRNLVHWVLGVDLEQFQHSLGDNKTLSDLFESCWVGALEKDMDCGLVIPDPTTQLGGIKFEAVLGDGKSRTFRVKLDETALIRGFEVDEGCVVAATKAGKEDIQRADRPAPGYVCISGPVVQGRPAPFTCPRSHGFWKNHLSDWPVNAVELGCKTYLKEEARDVMKTPVRGDASLILAKQLIAAKLNIENGSDPAPVSDIIESADELLCTFSGRLPYEVRPSTANGQEMIEYARILGAYNNGWLTPSCVNEE